MAITVTVDSTTTISSGGSLDWHGRSVFLRRRDGVLITAYQRSSNHAINDGTGIHLRFSDDNGATWSSEDTDLDGNALSGVPLKPADCTANQDAGEPWMIEAPNGDLLLFTWRVDYSVDNDGTYMFRSTDWGLSWDTGTGPIQFAGLTVPTAEDHNNRAFMTDDGFVINSGPHTGTIYASARVYEDHTYTQCAVVMMTSTDNGDSWTRVTTLISALDLTSGAIESGFERIGETSFHMLIRDNPHTNGYSMTSHDLGVTWSGPTDVTSTAGIVGRPRIYTRAHLQGKPNWWRDPVLIGVGFVQQTSGSSQDRRNCVWVSTDSGSTWSTPFYIDSSTEDSGYGDIFYDADNDQYVVHNYQGTLATASIKQYRLTIAGIPTYPGVWVDWGNDGAFDDSAVTAADGRLARMFPEAPGVTGGDEITSDVVSIEWSYGGSADHVSSSNPGTCTVIVQNSDGKYNPDNTSSVLYGLLKPNRPIWIGINEDGSMVQGTQQVYGIFAGYVRQIVPLVADGATAFAQLICEDPLGAWTRRPVRVAADTDYSYRTLREAILSDIGESLLDLASEPDTLPLASADSENALSVLDEIDKATGSRSWADPADLKELFYNYTVVDRHYKLTEAADDTINGDDVQGLDGYRVTEENIVNFQSVDVSQAQFPAGIATVWEYAEASFPLTSKRTIWAQFDDFVKDAALDYTNTGSTVTTAVTNFGTTAKIELWSAGSSVVQNLTIEGRQVQRNSGEAVTAEDAASQADYGKRAGSVISSTYSSTPALAQGLADFVVDKFDQPLKRPSITQTNEFAKMLPRRLYDTIELTVDRLSVASRRFEIIGISGSITSAADTAKLTSISWELQETPSQSALDLFNLNADVLNGSAVLGW